MTGVTGDSDHPLGLSGIERMLPAGDAGDGGENCEMFCSVRLSQCWDSEVSIRWRRGVGASMVGAVDRSGADP